MKLLRKVLDSSAKYFEKGQPLERLHPLYEAVDTLFYSPAHVTRGPSHVRDALDLKRMMGLVVVALMPCVFMAMYNTGLQAHRAVQQGFEISGWRASLYQWMGFEFSPESLIGCIVHGALYFIPLLTVTFAVGGTVEVIFALIRRHEVNEGFFVTGFLFPLIAPPDLPLWQAALGIGFGVLLAKEIFGGTGMNIFNPALMARAFLFFGYPGNFSGDEVWVVVDGYSTPTLMAQAMVGGTSAMIESQWTWLQAFIGTIPGAMGETSALFCLLGAIMLIVTKVASWRIMLGALIGSIATTLLLNGIYAAGWVESAYYGVPIWWHLVIGSWAFGVTFMATDPVSAAHSDRGRWIYGTCIGILIILIRVANPAYPEGTMLAILFMNVFASTIDHYVVQANIKRRFARYAATT
jgi:Na+-transporting NADH:ubiquinone oxidoreductase subunit B